jgi:hypothetical protein
VRETDRIVEKRGKPLLHQRMMPRTSRSRALPDRRAPSRAPINS